MTENIIATHDAPPDHDNVNAIREDIQTLRVELAELGVGQANLMTKDDLAESQATMRLEIMALQRKIAVLNGEMQNQLSAQTWKSSALIIVVALAVLVMTRVFPPKIEVPPIQVQFRPKIEIPPIQVQYVPIPQPIASAQQPAATILSPPQNPPVKDEADANAGDSAKSPGSPPPSQPAKEAETKDAPHHPGTPAHALHPRQVAPADKHKPAHPAKASHEHDKPAHAHKSVPAKDSHHGEKKAEHHSPR